MAGDRHGLGPRREALRLIARVLDDGLPLDGREPQTLSPSERARARLLASETLRRLGWIDGVLDQLISRAPPKPARAVLRLAATEILALGEAPHGAVDAAVRLVKEAPKGRTLSGLVNAVARKLGAGAGDLMADPAEIARASMPDWLHRRLVRAYDADIAAAIASAHLARAPIDLSLRDPGARAQWRETLGAAETTGGALRLPGGPGALTAKAGFAEGAWWVQDAAAQIPARLFGGVAGLDVVDICAAPGGKTMQLAAAGARVTALDISADRLDRLRANLTRTGLSAEIVAADALTWRPPTPFARVLLDAPCTATGTIRRHPDLPHLRSADDVASRARLQDALLDAAWEMTAPGGILVFCTCSLLPEEGEARARAFLRRQADAARVPLSAEEAGHPALVTAQGDLRTRPDLSPTEGGMDGFFAARFAKSAAPE